MAETTEDLAGIAASASREEWLDAIDTLGEDLGYFQRLGRAHWAFFADEGPTLLVSFETVDSIMARSDRLPVLYHLARRNGWSLLTIIADGPTFWRDKAVWSFFDRQVDDAFFEDFDRVLFYGAGIGAHAAAAYAVTAPGATAFLAPPRATLDPVLTGWDTRDRAARKFDFTSRYGYAPDMVDGLTRVYLAYDPYDRTDAMHAALFRGPHVQRLAMPRIGNGVEAALMRMGVLDDLLSQAVAGQLNALSFARAWRKRREDLAYLKALQAAVSRLPAREVRVVRHGADVLRLPRFIRRLSELE